MNDTTWVNGHKSLAQQSQSASCMPCYGPDLQGTALARAAVDRNFTLVAPKQARKRVVRINGETPVGCGLCHPVPVH